MKNTIQVILIEDHPEFREIIAFALDKVPDIDLCEQYGTAEEALLSLEHHVESCDVILLDLNLPGMSGLEAIPGLLRSAPEAKIIILTQSKKEADILKAISLGSSGYLLKSATLDQIAEGIRVVQTGGATIDVNLAQFILQSLQTKLPKSEMQNVLTEREHEILVLLADGLQKKEIAELFGISITTVKTHVGHIYHKLNVQNAPAAIAKAFRMGLFPTEDP